MPVFAAVQEAISFRSAPMRTPEPAGTQVKATPSIPAA